MTEAAMKEEPPDSTPNSPNMNGKRVVINLDEFRDGTSLWNIAKHKNRYSAGV